MLNCPEALFFVCLVFFVTAIQVWICCLYLNRLRFTRIRKSDCNKSFVCAGDRAFIAKVFITKQEPYFITENYFRDHHKLQD